MIHLKIFLLVASFLFPLVLSIQLFLTSKNNLSQKIMAFALLNAGLAFLFNYFYFQKEYSIYFPFHSIHAGFELWIYPSIYLYIKSIVIANDRLRNEFWHFLLGALMIVCASILFYIYVGKDDLIFFLKNNREGFKFVGFKFKILHITRYIALAIIAIQAIYYSIVFISIPIHYNERLKNEFSNIENFSIDWINRYNLSFGIAGLLGFIFYTFTPIYGHNELLIEFVLFVFSAFICAMGIISLFQQKSLVDLDEVDIETQSKQVSIIIKDDELVKKLIDYMENKQAYLQPDISLTTVSRMLGTNRTYLSSLINQQFGVNFNVFINQYRVKYIDEYMVLNPLATKEELIQIGGFGSLSTMKRAMSRNAE